MAAVRKRPRENSPSIPLSGSSWSWRTRYSTSRTGCGLSTPLKEDPSYLRKPELVAMLTPSQREEISLPETVRDFDSYPTHGTATTTRHGFEILFQRHVLDSEKGLPVLCRRHGGTACHAYPVTSKEPDQGKVASSAEASPSMNEFCSKMLEFMDLKSEIDTLLNEK